MSERLLSLITLLETLLGFAVFAVGVWRIRSYLREADWNQYDFLIETGARRVIAGGMMALALFVAISFVVYTLDSLLWRILLLV